MPWVLYRESEHDTNESYYTETEVLAVVTAPEIVKEAIPNQAVTTEWPNNDVNYCHSWRWDKSEDVWEYTALYSSWRYVLREFPLDVLSEVEK